MSRNQFRRKSAPSAVLTLTLSDFLWFLGSILIVLPCLQSSASFFSSSSPFAEAKPTMEARDSRAEFKCASVSQAVSSWFLYHYFAALWRMYHLKVCFILVPLWAGYKMYVITTLEARLLLRVEMLVELPHLILFVSYEGSSLGFLKGFSSNRCFLRT